MACKKRFMSFILILLIIIPITFSARTGEQSSNPSGGATGQGEDTQQAVQDSISNGGSWDGPIDEPIGVDLPGGGSATLSGPTKVNAGKIEKTGSLDYGSASARNVENFDTQPGGYTIGHASQLREGSTIILNARGVSFSDGVLKVESYDSFTGLDSISTDGINFSS